MQELIHNLLRLQEIDSFIDELSRKKELVPLKLQHHKNELQEITALVEERRAELQKKELDKRRVEKEIDEFETTIRRFQNQLNGAKTNEEYRALLSQIEHAKDRQSQGEDHILTLMEEIEEIESSLAQASKQFHKAENEYRQREMEANALLEKLEEGITVKRKERLEALTGLDEQLRKRYERIRSNKNSLAVATVEGEVCSGCHGTIPPQRINEIRRTDTLYTCQHCGRLLVWKA